VRVVNTHPL